MLNLKNVSKFYYSNGVVTSGFSKINLELSRGEFVAITGESGSGKSTLLNVISGLDTYEEGEMYINGEETSAFGSADFENYRRKYIANIYQSFNLINSYTVYQNIEMVLLLSNLKRKERKAKILDAIEKVGLTKFKNTKASKLSGGQKQRVAIARALVKDTPIIVADEPTGNLDSASASNVISLLSELAKDRLVVIVTHNYDQVEPYVTRKITMHDGHITEDVIISKPAIDDTFSASDRNVTVSRDEDIAEARRHHLRFGARLKLGTRNAFNIFAKFALILFIFVFVGISVISLYTSLRSSDYSMGLDGYNYYFSTDNSDKRIIIKKKDNSSISQADYDKLEAIDGVDYIYKEDLLADSEITIEYDSEDEWFYFYGSPKLITTADFTEDDLAYGHFPVNDSQIVISMSGSNYNSYEDQAVKILNGEYTVYVNAPSAYLSLTQTNGTYRVCGIYIDDSLGEYGAYGIYVPTGLFDTAAKAINSGYSEVSAEVAGKVYENSSYVYGGCDGKIVTSPDVKKGCAVISENWTYMWSDNKAIGKNVKINIKNLYFSVDSELTIDSLYNYDKYKKLSGQTIEKDEFLGYYDGTIFVNEEEYEEYFNKGSFQSSVFIKDAQYSESVLAELDRLGYKTMYVKDIVRSYTEEFDVIGDIFNAAWSTTLVVILFFITYFIIRLIFKSRNVYFATIRMLGASAKDCSGLIRIDLFVMQNLAIIVIAAMLVLTAMGYIDFDFANEVIKYLGLKDYVILYAGLTLMSLFIANRYSRKLFKTSALNTYKEV